LSRNIYVSLMMICCVPFAFAGGLAFATNRIVLFILLFAIAMAFMIPYFNGERRRQEREDALERIEQRCCGACGYNLTANTSGVCPECGTPVPAKPEVVA
jgi:hypothetical protein